MTAHGHVGDLVIAYRVLPSWPVGDSQGPVDPGRDREIVAMIRGGSTAAAVAARLGISRERVRQIWKRATATGLPTHIRQAEARARRTSWCRRCRTSYPWRAYRSHVRTPVHVAALLWAKVDRNGPVPEFASHLGPCWIWTGALIADDRTDGYGHARALGEHNAHRIAYRLSVGPIPAGLTLDHLCRVTRCVNPSHLEPVTVKENIRRGKNGVLRHLRNPGPPRKPKSHCLRGHARTPENVSPSGNCRPCWRIRDRARRTVA